MSDDTDTPPEATIGHVCNMLKNPRRREVIRVVGDSAPIEIGDLTDRVAEVELGKPIDDVTAQERKNVYVGLYQSHLPKLDSEGVLDVDRREIDRGPRFDAYADALAGIEELLGDADDADDTAGLVGRLLGGGRP